MITMEKQNTIDAFVAVSKEFFNNIGGVVKEVYFTNRRNIEILDIASSPEVQVCTLYVEFKNNNLFGSTNYIDAYKRYRKMRYDWWDYLEKNKFFQWKASTEIIGHFVPLLSADNQYGGSYEMEGETSYGQYLTKYSDLQQKNPYYKEFYDKYQVKWLLQDGNKIVIGPDAGLLFSTIAYSQCCDVINTFVDVGAGTGELSSYLIRNNLVKKVILNEVSGYLMDHLRDYVGCNAQKKNVTIEYQFKDALEMEFPESAALISLGIYYGSQPQYIKNFGEKIRTALGEEGILVIQSGMLEGKFNISSVVGDDERLFAWNWYSKENSLSHYFPYIESIFVADEVVTMAANKYEALGRLKQTLFTSFKATEIPLMDKYE